MTIESLDFTQIRMDGGTQSRADIDEATVREYQEAMAAGAEFPPPIVFYDGNTYWLADGFHRVFAWRRVSLAGRVQCDIRQGTQRDAILYSVGANTRHGLRRNPADKRRAVLRLLHDPEWGQWSSRAIADRCGVSHTFVDDLRKKAADGNGATGNVASSERVYERNGQTQVMDTSRIGNGQAAPVYREIGLLEQDVWGWVRQNGGTDLAHYQIMLPITQRAKPGPERFVLLKSHLQTEGVVFRVGDLWQACMNVCDQLRVRLAAADEQTIEPNYAPISRLESIVRGWLPFRTGGTDRATWLRVLAGLRAGRGDDWHTALLPYVVTRAPEFRGDDLAQACHNLYQQIGGEVVTEAVPAASPQRAELPPLPTAPAAIEVPAETAETPVYGGIAAVWGPLLGQGATLPPDQVGPALRWLLGELEFLSARAGHDGVEMSLASAALAVKRAIGKGMF